MNREETHRRKTFGRRAAILAAGKLGLMAALGARLYYLQVVEADRYRVLAEENRVNLRLLAPPRGRILDRGGAPLALNRENYCLVMVPEAAGDIERALDALSAWVALDDDERARIRREAARRPPFVPILVREHLAWAQVAAMEVNAPWLPGISIDARRTRLYPHGAALAHVLGYVAAVSEKEKTGDPLLALPGFPIGKNGMEKVHDSALRGQAGALQVEVNAHGRVIRELSRREGAPGSDVSLTVDLGLQKFAADRLGEESAAAVLLDIPTGDVLASASTPAFDPNLFTRGEMTGAQWRALVNNPRSPLVNKAVAGRYPPGSTFKPAVALAALEAGAVDPDRTVFCGGRMKLGNHAFHCWKRGGHGHLAMRDAIAQSCDIYFYDIALKVGIERIAAMAERLGLGPRLGLDLPNEADGLVPTPGWKRAMRGEPWQKGETVGVGIGQSFVLATPLQLAVMTARLADGARAVAPRLTRAVRRAPGAAGSFHDAAWREPAFAPLGLAPRALAIVREGMNRVVNARRGTAFRARIEDPARAMAGKTGTSQVRRITMAERQRGVVKNKDRPWKHRDHALFVAWAPLAAPRFALSVVIEHGGESKVAAAWARDILLEAQRRLPPAADNRAEGEA